jgi:hypothetical protein
LEEQDLQCLGHPVCGCCYANNNLHVRCDYVHIEWRDSDWSVAGMSGVSDW